MSHLLKFRWLLAALIPLLMTTTVSEAGESLQPVRLESFQVNRFWQQQYKRLTEKWLPHCVKQMEEGGRGQELKNLVNTARVLKLEPHGAYTGLPWSDAYVYNTMESICLALMIDPVDDAKLAQAQAHLREKMEEWIPIILAAQLPSGYIHSFHTVNRRPHYEQIADHEFYVMGYFLEMGVAHYRSTAGKDRRLYDAAVRLADHLDETFGPEPKRTWKNGHAGLEYALCRLARLVSEVEGPGRGDKYYLLAKHFLDHQHEIEPTPYNQSERAAITMKDASGHAVRATYFYTAMADMALLADNAEYLQAVDRLWDSAIHRKHYITGGVGASHHGEAFADDFDLRNDGYCESCAGCGMGFWADRMHRIHRQAHYHDVFERLLYNNVLGAMELSGENFFYQNPLTSDRSRYPWHVCPCCVGNIPRTLLLLKDVTYATNDQRNALYVNHYFDCTASIPSLAGGKLKISQETNYPWDGEVKLTLSPEHSSQFALKLRIPDRTESKLYTASPDITDQFELRINGEQQSVVATDGYVTIERSWQAGDVVELSLPMPIQRVHCDSRVEANRGRVAITRGPLVYNFENVDHDIDVRELVIPADAKLTTAWKPDLLEGVTLVEGQAVSQQDPSQQTKLTGIPNFVRLNRGGFSQVWMLEDQQ